MRTKIRIEFRIWNSRLLFQHLTLEHFNISYLYTAMYNSENTKRFIIEHRNDDVDRLLLSANKFPDIDMKYVANQILIRRQLSEKVPEWSKNENLCFPSKISAEQCSSAITAQYKQQLIEGRTVWDMTGGLGIDSFYYAQKAEKVIYTDFIEEYCEIAKNNFNVLNVKNIEVVCGDSSTLMGQVKTDTVYIDPARRSGTNERLYALADCSPNILNLKEVLLKQAKRIVIKISPMADISETCRLLPETTEIHILSVRNECKELLFILENKETGSFPPIFTVNFLSAGRLQQYNFCREQEKELSCTFSQKIGQYLYEPNSAILKGGAFKSIAHDMNVAKMHRDSHLYTSDTYIPGFPGRIFRVKEILGFSGKELSYLNKKYPTANISTRNFPLTVKEIRKKTKIREGGDNYLFFTTNSLEQRIIIISERSP